MTTYRYTTTAAGNEAKAVGVAIPVSYKQSYEVAKHLRGKSLAQAKRILEDAIALRRAIPITRFNTDTGHKAGMAAGRYCVNTCTHILKLIKTAESNAQHKGLSAANLVVRHIAAQRGPKSFHYGRQRRRQFKRAHVEIVLREEKSAQPEKKAAPKKAAAPKSQSPKQTKAPEAKTQ
jgi:large subunit ribosomal protein L22